MPEEGQDLPEPHEGPDPHNWPEQAPRLCHLVCDLENIRRARDVLDSFVDPQYAGIHQEAQNFLLVSAAQLRAELSAEILHAYGIEPGAPAAGQPPEGAAPP